MTRLHSKWYAQPGRREGGYGLPRDSALAWLPRTQGLFRRACVPPHEREQLAARLQGPPTPSYPRTCVQKLLDDMENEVDSGNANLKRETERTALVTADSKTCWLYAVICILIAVLVALVVIRYG